MSNMKYDAIVGSGIYIVERVEIPEEMLPLDSMVEMEAKKAVGYFHHGKNPTESELNSVKGRGWDDAKRKDSSDVEVKN